MTMNQVAQTEIIPVWPDQVPDVELHLYAQGGHGFGMNRQGLPSDAWIDRFWEWLQSEGFA